MKNIIFLFAAILILFPFAASANQLPASTWQVYGGGILTVYSGSNSSTSIVFQGDPLSYHGSATSYMSSIPIFSINNNIDTKWQVYSAGILTVRSTDSKDSSIIYTGPPSGYFSTPY